MKKMVKRLIAVALSVTMVVSGLHYRQFNVNADTGDEVDASVLTNPEVNIAYGKIATPLYYKLDGAGTTPDKITDGSLTTSHCALSGAADGWGANSPTYVIIDLGDYYDASTIDEIVIAYKNSDTNVTPINKNYSIKYSVDGTNFDTIAASRENLAALDDETAYATIDHVSSVEGAVRYVKVDYEKAAGYGIQLKEVAVLDTDGNLAYANLGTCDNPAEVIVESCGTNSISITVVAGEGQEGYTYNAYLDSEKMVSISDMQTGTKYTISGVSAGLHTVKVCSINNGARSEGITSSSVDVKSAIAVIADANMNLALGKTFTLSSDKSLETGGDSKTALTNGIVGRSDYVTSTKGEVGAWYTIDLEKVYDAATIDEIEVWMRHDSLASSIGTYEVQYSADGTDFTPVSTIDDDNLTLQYNSNIAQSNDGANVDIHYIKSDVSDVTGSVRYVRIYFTEAVGWGAQLSEIAVLDMNGDAGEGEEITVTNPESITLSSSNPHKLTINVTAGENQTNYKYKAYIDDSQTALISDMDAGVDYTITVSPGNHTVKVVSVDSGVESEGITDSIDVKAVANTHTVSATSDEPHKVAVNVSAGEGQNGYTYRVYLDESDEIKIDDMTAGQDYVINNITSGTHKVKVVAVYKDAEENEFTSTAVETTVDVTADMTISAPASVNLSSPKPYDMVVNITPGDNERVYTYNVYLDDTYTMVLEGVAGETNLSFVVDTAGEHYVRVEAVYNGNVSVLTTSNTVDVQDVATAASVSGTSVIDTNQITFTVTAGDNQEGYTYIAYLDDSDDIKAENIVAGEAYTINDVPTGTHKVRIVSVYNGHYSTPIYSDDIEVEVTVIDYAGLINTEKNIAKGKNYVLSSGKSTEGDGSITDGVVDGTYATPTKGVAGSWYYIDLGEIYEAEGIDAVAIWYRIDFGGTWPQNGGLEIQYSVDSYNFETVAVITQAEFNTQKAGQSAPILIKTDISKDNLPEEVRYVRVYYPNAVSYGAQTSEVGIYDLNGDLKLSEKVVEVNNPASVSASSTELGKLSFEVQAAANQEEYRYVAFLDDNIVPCVTNVVAGQEYTIENVKNGTHTVKVISLYQGRTSEGITSESVEVLDYESYLRDSDKNLAFLREYKLDSVDSTEGTGSITDGILGTSYVTPSKAKAGSWYTIDLGDIYNASGIEAIAIWYRIIYDECYPKNDFSIQYSTDNEVFYTVATVTKTEIDRQRDIFNEAPFKVVTDVSEQNVATEVRYVRIFYPNSIEYGAQTSEVGIFDMDGDLTASESAVNVTSVDQITAESNAYNEITWTFNAVTDKEYTYDVYVIDKEGKNDKKFTDVMPGTTSLRVATGTYKLAVVSKDTSGASSLYTYSNEVVVNSFSELESKENVINDSQWHSVGGFAYKVSNENISGTVSADVDNDNHIQTKFTIGEWDRKNIQLRKRYVGLIPNETYTFTMDISADNDDGAYYIVDTDEAIGLVIGTKSFTYTAKAQENGDFEVVIDLGLIGSDILMDYSNVTLVDSEGEEAHSFPISDELDVVGFQIKTNTEKADEYAFRAVCKAPKIGSTITVADIQYEVANVGTIYVMDPYVGYDKENNYLTDKYTTLDNTQIYTASNGIRFYKGAHKYNDTNYTYGYISTDAGIIANYNPSDTTHTYYMQTMESLTSVHINQTFHTRAFVVATDGTIIYSTKVVDMSYLEIASTVYNKGTASSYTGHLYLQALLSDESKIGVGNPYLITGTKDYGWNDNLFTPSEKETLEVTTEAPADDEECEFENGNPEFN